MCKNCDNKTRRKWLSFVTLGAKQRNVSNAGWKTGRVHRVSSGQLRKRCSLPPQSRAQRNDAANAVTGLSNVSVTLWSSQLSAAPTCYFGRPRGWDWCFAPFRLNAVTGYTSLMLKARTVAQTFASGHRFTGSLAPGAFVASVTVLVSAQPQLATKTPLLAGSLMNRFHLGYGGFHL